MRIIMFVLALAASQAFGDESLFVCKMPNGKTVMQGSPCAGASKTMISSTAPAETREQAEQRMRSHDLLVQQMRNQADAITIQNIANVQAQRDWEARQQYEKAQTRARAAPAYHPEVPDVMDELREVTRSVAPIRLTGEPPQLPQQPQPSAITSCDRNGCWDDVGNRYHRTSGGMHRSDGRYCQSMGNALQCN